MIAWDSRADQSFPACRWAIPGYRQALRVKHKVQKTATWYSVERFRPGLLWGVGNEDGIHEYMTMIYTRCRKKAN